MKNEAKRNPFCTDCAPLSFSCQSDPCFPGQKESKNRIPFRNEIEKLEKEELPKWQLGLLKGLFAVENMWLSTDTLTDVSDKLFYKTSDSLSVSEK